MERFDKYKMRISLKPAPIVTKAMVGILMHVRDVQVVRGETNSQPFHVRAWVGLACVLKGIDAPENEECTGC